jgi:branched-chain amino acid transport system permease protein
MRRLRPLAILAVIAFLYALPLLHIPVLDADEADFASILFYPVGIYVLLAIGLYVAVGQAGLLNLGHAAFFAVGAYTMGMLNTSLGLSYFVVLPIAMLIAMLFGLLLAIPTLRLRGDYLAVATIGFAQVVQIVLTNAGIFGGVRGISNIAPPPSIGPLEFGVLNPLPFDWLVLTLILLSYAAVRQLERTHIGRAWSAVRADEDVAELMGVPTFHYKALALALSAGIAGLAGATYATKVSFISPETFDASLAILLLAALVLGGTRSLLGAVLGTALVAYLPERFRAFGDFRMLVFAAVLMLVMIFRPQGLASLAQMAGLRRFVPGARATEDLTASDQAVQESSHVAR